MSITAQDIQEQVFRHSMRGYDSEEVDVFLEKVASEIDLLVAENAELKAAAEAAPAAAPEPAPVDTSEADAAIARAQEAEARAAELSAQLRAANDGTGAKDARIAELEQLVVELQQKLDEKGNMDSAISNAFIAAQRAADNLKEEARAEGERMYRESEAKAREFIREALIEKQRILNEVETLSVSCNNFRAEYKALLARFTAEADAHLYDAHIPEVSDSAIAAMMPDIDAAVDSVMPQAPVSEEAATGMPSVQTESATDAIIADDELDIEEID